MTDRENAAQHDRVVTGWVLGLERADERRQSVAHDRHAAEQVDVEPGEPVGAGPRAFADAVGVRGVQDAHAEAAGPAHAAPGE